MGFMMIQGWLGFSTMDFVKNHPGMAWDGFSTNHGIFV